MDVRDLKYVEFSDKTHFFKFRYTRVSRQLKQTKY